MKLLFAIFLVGVCAVSALLEAEDQPSKQKEIWRLFKYVHQPSYYHDHINVVQHFNFYNNAQDYEKPEIVENFYNHYKYDKLLPKGEVFSIFNEEHLEQAILLFKLFYHANSYEIFYKTALWARNHINEGLYVYSLSVALIHRLDTAHIPLPPIYEIYPHYFFHTEVIQKAQYYKQISNNEKYHHYIIYSNHSNHYLDYYTEDLGVNSFYYYYNLHYPFWMTEVHEHYGEIFYHMYQQILARYYLERLSHHHGEIPSLNWDLPLEDSFYPHLSYPNGLEFPIRPQHAHYNDKNHLHNVHHYEQRILDALDSGFMFTTSGQIVNLYSKEGLDMFSKLIEGNPHSPYYKYYGAYQVAARHLLGHSLSSLSPSALEHFETSLRDPVFYQFYKKLLAYFHKYKSSAPHYTKHDLNVDGVAITDVKFGHLITYFDWFYADLSNAVYVTPEEFLHETFNVTVAQKRLNYEPFTYKVLVQSKQHIYASIKVFLGPKHDEQGKLINLTENWMNFVQFDHFVHKLEPGQNIIHRNSEEIHDYLLDKEIYSHAYEKVGVKTQYVPHENEHHYGYPHRLMLPKGTEGGLEYQFFFIVTTTLEGEDVHEQVPFKYAMGYPFDRPVYWEHIFHELPNTHFHDVTIFFKHIHDVQQEHHGSSFSQEHHGSSFSDEDDFEHKHVVPQATLVYSDKIQYSHPSIHQNVDQPYPLHHYDHIHH